MIWTWSVGQISTLLAVPWQQWPLYEAILLVLVLVGVIWALYKAAIELFAAGERILPAFARLLIVLVRTLPSIVFAGLIALGGVWLINHLDNNLIQLPVASNQLSTAPASSNHSPSNEQSSENR
jgi:ABC-type arginine transport system permease subunit